MSSAKCGTDTKGKQDYEKEFSTLHRCGNVLFWGRIAPSGLPLPTLGRDTSQRAYRLRRNLDLRW